MRVSVPRIPRQCYCLNASPSTFFFFCNNNTTISSSLSSPLLSSSIVEEKIQNHQETEINPFNKHPKYYEIAQFPSFLMKGEEKEGIIITSESQTAPQQETETQTEITIEADHQTKIKPEDDDDAIKSEEQNDEDQPTVFVSEDDDGFKTPTSSDHRITPITECPPAPKKPRPPPPKLKRKAPGSSRSIQLDESIFTTIAKDEDDALPQKIKKARTDDSDRS